MKLYNLNSVPPFGHEYRRYGRRWLVVDGDVGNVGMDPDLRLLREIEAEGRRVTIARGEDTSAYEKLVDKDWLTVALPEDGSSVYTMTHKGVRIICGRRSG